MKWTLHVIAFHKTITKFGVAMASVVVDGKYALVYLENSDVVILRRDSNARAFKQVGLCGHVKPVAHI